MWKNGNIPTQEIQGEITNNTVKFAEDFGTYLAKDEYKKDDKSGDKPLTTTQLRRFFGEVKRQQMMGYNATSFVMLKPKLAYAVGRAKKSEKAGQNKAGKIVRVKIEDFYTVIAKAIDDVEAAPDKKKAFKNFIMAFEAIVAYHKANEQNND